MSNFITNVIKLVSGSVIAQMLGVLLIPIITRLYAPDDYGIFQLFLSISSILAIVSCLSYQMAIMLPKDDEDSINIVALCIILVFTTSIITGGFFILFSEWVGEILNTPDIAQYLIYMPIIVLFNGSFLVLNYWLIRRTRFGTLATAKVTQVFSSKAIQIGMGLGATSPIGLILGQVAGYVISPLVMLRGIKNDLKLINNISLGKIKALAIRYKRFPIFNSWSAVANSVSLQVAPLMLALFFNPTVVGHYAIAHTVINMPMNLIGSATGQVFFQKASEEKNRTGSVKEVVREVHQRLVSIGVFPILLLMILGEELFGLVLGTQWTTAGEYSRILAPWIFFVFIASPLSTIFSVLEKQTIGLSFNLLILFSRIGVLYIGGVYGDPIIALILYSITGVMFWGGMNLYVLKISDIKYTTGIKEIIKFFMIGIGVTTPLIIIKYLAQPLYILVSVAGILAIIYYSIVISSDDVLKREIKGFLNKVKP